ncbi:hypothetical protein FNF29_02234 [Cafeteria roenbergensis]|uniref:E2F/DP family winged-helix DNA-binding domain-containing protein n=1 Tax=Cafeteria roenbergensis TaxID=33653 RepID=A0A5A8CNS1_CAFRO|nr:hypothetical protein FNF29_02234 [Cafeteria roenbergensis]|eukprot:KAA0154705.1 hypothetical protein FNF29_02234 [Cafeteria roenbergensis]
MASPGPSGNGQPDSDAVQARASMVSAAAAMLRQHVLHAIRLTAAILGHEVPTELNLPNTHHQIHHVARITLQALQVAVAGCDSGSIASQHAQALEQARAFLPHTANEASAPRFYVPLEDAATPPEPAPGVLVGDPASRRRGLDIWAPAHGALPGGGLPCLYNKLGAVAQGASLERRAAEAEGADRSPDADADDEEDTPGSGSPDRPTAAQPAGSASSSASVAAGAASGSSKSRRDRGLNVVCENFLAYCASGGVDVVVLDKIADKLDIQRRRIYDLVNIFEAVGITTRKERNKYFWHGTSMLPLVLERLKARALADPNVCPPGEGPDPGPREPLAVGTMESTQLRKAGAVVCFGVPAGEPESERGWRSPSKAASPLRGGRAPKREREAEPAKPLAAKDPNAQDDAVSSLSGTGRGGGGGGGGGGGASGAPAAKRWRGADGSPGRVCSSGNGPRLADPSAVKEELTGDCSDPSRPAELPSCGQEVGVATAAAAAVLLDDALTLPEGSLQRAAADAAVAAARAAAVASTGRFPLAQWGEGGAPPRDTAGEKSMGAQAQRLVMLFLAGRPVVCLEHAAAIMMGEEASKDARRLKTKVRRLYDIANVLQSLGLVHKVSLATLPTRKAAFAWRGVGSVPLLPGLRPSVTATGQAASSSSVASSAKEGAGSATGASLAAHGPAGIRTGYGYCSSTAGPRRRTQRRRTARVAGGASAGRGAFADEDDDEDEDGDDISVGSTRGRHQLPGSSANRRFPSPVRRSVLAELSPSDHLSHLDHDPPRDSGRSHPHGHVADEAVDLEMLGLAAQGDAVNAAAWSRRAHAHVHGSDAGTTNGAATVSGAASGTVPRQSVSRTAAGSTHQSAVWGDDLIPGDNPAGMGTEGFPFPSAFLGEDADSDADPALDVDDMDEPLPMSDAAAILYKQSTSGAHAGQALPSPAPAFGRHAPWQSPPPHASRRSATASSAPGTASRPCAPSLPATLGGIGSPGNVPQVATPNLRQPNQARWDSDADRFPALLLGVDDASPSPARASRRSAVRRAANPAFHPNTTPAGNRVGFATVAADAGRIPSSSSASSARQQLRARHAPSATRGVRETSLGDSSAVAAASAGGASPTGPAIALLDLATASSSKRRLDLSSPGHASAARGMRGSSRDRSAAPSTSTGGRAGRRGGAPASPDRLVDSQLTLSRATVASEARSGARSRRCSEGAEEDGLAASGLSLHRAMAEPDSGRGADSDFPGLARREGAGAGRDGRERAGGEFVAWLRPSEMRVATDGRGGALGVVALGGTLEERQPGGEDGIFAPSEGITSSSDIDHSAGSGRGASEGDGIFDLHTPTRDSVAGAPFGELTRKHTTAKRYEPGCRRSAGRGLASSADRAARSPRGGSSDVDGVSSDGDDFDALGLGLLDFSDTAI